MDAKAIVTGQVSPVAKDPLYDSSYAYIADQPGAEPYFSDGKEFISQGFIVFRDDEDNVSLKLLMLQPPDDDKQEPSLYAVELDAFIKLKDILSYEHSRDLLATYLPGLLETVDTNTSRAGSRGEALLSLQGLDMSEINGLGGESDDDGTRARLLTALCVYATVATRLDSSLPYVVEYDYDAPALIAGKDGPIVVDLPYRKATVTLHSIETLYGPTSPPEMILGLTATIHPSDNPDEDCRALLCLDDVKSISSLRDEPSLFIGKSPSLRDRLRSFRRKLHR